MSDTYYVRSQGKVLGPFSFEALKTKAGKGHLKKTHQVSTDKESWQSARKVEGLFPPPAPPRQPERAQEPAQAQPNPQLAEPELVEVELIDDEPIEIAEPDEDVEWHYCLQGDEQPQGPVTEAKMRRLLQGGRLPMDTLVWNENLGDWVEAGRIPALQAGPQVAPQPQAAPVISTEGPFINTHVSPSATAGELPVPALASASLILGILGIPTIGVTSLFAIIFGHLGLQQVKANRHIYQGENMAKTGMLLGYIVLSLVVLGLAIWLILQMAKS